MRSVSANGKGGLSRFLERPQNKACLASKLRVFFAFYVVFERFRKLGQVVGFPAVGVVGGNGVLAGSARAVSKIQRSIQSALAKAVAGYRAWTGDHSAAFFIGAWDWKVDGQFFGGF